MYVRFHSDGSAPQLQMIDWPAAARDVDSTTGRSLGNSPVTHGHLEDLAQLYLASEFGSDFPDPIEMDLFGLGAGSYLRCRRMTLMPWPGRGRRDVQRGSGQ